MLNKKEPKYITELTTEFNRYIRLRDGQCVTCGTKRRLTCSHLVTAQKTSTRWDYQNCHCQCSSCNKSHEFYPERYTYWFITKFGFGAYTRLYYLSLQQNQLLPDEEQAGIMLAEVRQKIDELAKAREVGMMNG